MIIFLLLILYWIGASCKAGLDVDKHVLQAVMSVFQTKETARKPRYSFESEDYTLNGSRLLALSTSIRRVLAKSSEHLYM